MRSSSRMSFVPGLSMLFVPPQHQYCYMHRLLLFGGSTAFDKADMASIQTKSDMELCAVPGRSSGI